MRTPSWKIALAALAVVTGCGQNTPTTPANPGPGPGPAVLPRGSRTLAIDVKAAEDGDWAAAMQLAINAGVNDVKFSFDWNVLDDGFTGAGVDLVGILEATMASFPVSVTLVLRPLDTVGPTYPAAIPTSPLDNAQALSAFSALIDTLHAHTPGLRARGQIRAIQIGNEIDGYLGTDATRWAQFGHFYRQAAAHVRALDWGNPSLEVSTIIMYGGATDPTTRGLFTAECDSAVDMVTVNYYPLAPDFSMRPPSDVDGDFQTLVDAFPGREIQLQECGYASGTTCGSSEEKQRQFVANVFAAWDKHASQITHIDFTWLTDQSQATVDQWVIDYGMSGSPNEACFRDYLGTLGLRTYAGAGTDKPAFGELAIQAAARGW